MGARKVAGPSGPRRAAACGGVLAAACGGVLAAAFGALLAAACCGPPATDDTDLTAIRSLSPRFVKAIDARDPDAVAELYDEEAVVLPPGSGPIRGRVAIAQFWRSMIGAPLQSVRLEPSEVIVAGDRAYETGAGTLRIASPAGILAARAKYVTVMRREADGSWKLTHDIWNLDADPAPEGAPGRTISAPGSAGSPH